MGGRGPTGFLPWKSVQPSADGLEIGEPHKMRQGHLRIVFITLIAAATAGCGGGAPSPTPSPTPSALPSALPSQTRIAPSPSGQAVATLTLMNGVEADGPGTSVSDALAHVAVEPQLVNGIVLREADGAVWLCEVLLESSQPQCAEPRLRVENWLPEDQTFANGEGLHEANGVRWVEKVQLFGVVRP